jgi:hypothetical protein
VNETVELLAARAPKLRDAPRDTGLIAWGDKGYHGHDGYDETGQRVITPLQRQEQTPTRRNGCR